MTNKKIRKAQIEAERLAGEIFHLIVEKHGIRVSTAFALLRAAVVVLKGLGETEEAAHRVLKVMYKTTQVEAGDAWEVRLEIDDDPKN